MKILRSWIFWVIFLFIPVTSMIYLSWYHVPDILFTYFAKEFCTCYYVHGRTVTECRETVQRIPIPLIPIDIDEETRTVEAGIFSTTKARHVSERFGCQVIQ